MNLHEANRGCLCQLLFTGFSNRYFVKFAGVLCIMSVDPATVTYRYERMRAVSSGILESAGTAFLLLILVRGFHAGSISKGLVAAGANVGLLLTPWVVLMVERAAWKTGRAAALLAAVGAGCLLIAAAFPLLPVFVACSVIGMACTAAMVPLLTQIYQENYSESERGRRFSGAVMIRAATAVIFSEAAGWFLTVKMEWFRWLLLIFAGAFVFSGFCLSRVPSRALVTSGSTHPFRGLRYVRDDRLFRLTLISWMLMGFGNLMMLPMRVEYLANPRYQLGLNPQEIAFLVAVIPNAVRIVMSPLWGWLFDRMNFFVLRVILNLGFAIGILGFFMGDSMTGLVLGAILFGIALAGGDVAWSLWVTKFAPPERVADYMSVHTFFTGIRGLIAPLVAFQWVVFFEITTLGWISAAMIVAASLMLIPEIKFGKGARKGSALVEEISE